MAFDPLTTLANNSADKCAFSKADKSLILTTIFLNLYCVFKTH